MLCYGKVKEKKKKKTYEQCTMKPPFNWHYLPQLSKAMESPLSKSQGSGSHCNTLTQGQLGRWYASIVSFINNKVSWKVHWKCKIGNRLLGQVELKWPP